MCKKPQHNILLTLRRELSTKGGVRAYWNSLLIEMKKYNSLNISIFEMGGHGKNIFGILKDQIKFHNNIKNQKYELAFLNPSLGKKSFFRDAIFAKQLIKKDIPFIVFFHGWDLIFEKQVDQKYKTFFLNSFGKAKKIFVLSNDFKIKILEWGYTGEIIIETTNVDSSLLKNFSFDKKIENIKQTNNIQILFLARLLKEKGVFDTVEAFRNLNKKYKNIQLTIAGNGKDLDQLKQKVKNDNNIIVVGYVEGKKKIDLFTEQHIYCFPTFYGEGLPTSILEAMAFGMPVITTNMGGLKKFFQDEKMGYFVEPQNIDDLTRKLEKLLFNKNTIIEISNYNYNYAHRKLLNSVVSKRIYKHIKEVINGK
jgi:glycosyltransferase involved in cell wall biosynthesis